MKIRMYMDEDSMSAAVSAALKRQGIDVIAAKDASMVEHDDQEHLEYATKQNRVLCTFNVGHFYELHTEFLQSGRHHAGIILVKQQEDSVGEVLRRLLKLIDTLSEEEMADRVEFLSNWK